MKDRNKPTVVTLQEADRELKRGKYLPKEVAKSRYNLARSVYFIWDAGVKVEKEIVPFWKLMKYTSWIHMVDVEFGIGATAAKKMKSVWRILEVMHDKAWNRQLRLDSMEKMHLVAKICEDRPDHIETWLKKAKLMTIHELQKEWQKIKPKPPGSGPPAAGFHFHAPFYDKKKIAVVVAQIALFRQKTGIFKNEELLYQWALLYRDSVK